MPLRVIQGRPIRFGMPQLGARTLDVPQINQEQSNWCWAACTDMVLHYYDNPEARQCEFANWLFQQTICCLEPTNPDCNRPCSPNQVSAVYTNWNIRSTLVTRTVSFAALQAEIDADRPVEVAFYWNGGGGHVAIVCGWDSNDTGPFVRVNDPAYGSGGVYYDDLLTAYGQGSWALTWTGIRR